jgi:hypothetical protein
VNIYLNRKYKNSKKKINVGLCAYSLLKIISVLIRLANLGAGGWEGGRAGGAGGWEGGRV